MTLDDEKRSKDRQRHDILFRRDALLKRIEDILYACPWEPDGKIAAQLETDLANMTNRYEHQIMDRLAGRERGAGGSAGEGS